MPNANIDELFEQTLRGDYDDSDAWHAVHALHGLGTHEIFDKAKSRARSSNPLERARVADVLGQLGNTPEHPTPLFVDESFKVLMDMLESETDPVPLSAILAALGHLGNPAAIPQILPFSFHPSSGVRFGLAFALGCFADDERSVSTLVKLMGDEDSEVRDWATFGLGDLGDFDSPRIREVLFKNLGDPDEDVRDEAMVGLAKRKEMRSLPEVIKALQADEPSPRAIDAANFLLDRTSDPLDEAAACLKALHQRFPAETQSR